MKIVRRPRRSAIEPKHTQPTHIPAKVENTKNPTPLIESNPAGLLSINGVGFFVFSTFAGMWVGCVCFGSIADRLGRRTIFIYSLIWYSVATLIMGFQNTAAGID